MTGIRDIAPKYIDVNFVDTTYEDSARNKAMKNGIRRSKIGNMQVYWGMRIGYGDKSTTIAAFEADSQKVVEYKIISALRGLSKSEKPVLYILSSLPVVGVSAKDVGVRPDWEFVAQLRKIFDVKSLPQDFFAIPSDAAAIAVIHPKSLGDQSLQAIDRYMFRGGRCFLALDSFARAELSFMNSIVYDVDEIQLSSNLEALLNSYGVKFSRNRIVGDSLLAAKVKMVGRIIDYPFFMKLGHEQMDASLKITAFIDDMLYAEGGFFNLTKLAEGLKFQPLLTTTAASGSIESVLVNFQRPEDLMSSLVVDENKYLLSGMLTGFFPAVFEENKSEPGQKGSLIFIGDVDMLHDKNMVEQVYSKSFAFKKPKNDNLEFVIGALEFLGGSENLFSIRSRDRIFRSFDALTLAVKAADAFLPIRKRRLQGDLKLIRENLEFVEERSQMGSESDNDIAEAASLRYEEAAIVKMINHLGERRDQEKFFVVLPVIIIQLLLIPLCFLIPYVVFGSGFFARHFRHNRRRSSERRVEERRLG